jgi:hypothetical protein
MSNADDYNSVLNIITEISYQEQKSPAMPVEVFAKEAEYLAKWAQDDKEALTGRGLDWNLVTDMPARIGALREADSRWYNLRFSQAEAAKAWNEESDEGYDFRDILVHEFRHAYREDPALLTKVSGIADGNGHADMIQDLNDLAVLGKANIEPLQATNFDTAELDRAAHLSDVLGDLLASAEVDRETNNVTRIIRDQAYTYLKQAVDEVRTVGQFVFWRDEQRLKGYASNYFRKRNGKSKNETSPEPNASV